MRIKELILGLPVSLFHKRCVKPDFSFFFFNGWTQTVHPRLQRKYAAGKGAASAGSALELPPAKVSRAPAQRGREARARWRRNHFLSARYAATAACSSKQLRRSPRRTQKYIRSGEPVSSSPPTPPEDTEPQQQRFCSTQQHYCSLFGLRGL